MAHSPFKSPTPVGDLLLTAPLLGPFDFKADCARPGRWTQAAAALLDTWVPWLGYLGLGIGLQDFALGSFVAGAAAACGLGFQAYRHCVQKTLRIWPKVNPLVLSLTWMGNAVFALLAPAETLARYTLFVVISGALLGNALSLTMGRPVLLEEAMESVESREEAAHPRFARMHTRASFALLALACVQWPSFFLAAFVFYGNAALAPILLLVVPVGSLFVAVVGIGIYLWTRVLREELAAQLKPDGLFQYTTL